MRKQTAISASRLDGPWQDKHSKNKITLLQERRTALISAAVTGKIDLRDWQEPSQAT